MKNKITFAIALLLFLASCGAPLSKPTLPPVPSPTVMDDAAATLASLEQVDDHPLYTMRYFGTYPESGLASHEPTALSMPEILPVQTSCPLTWGCSLFATLGDKNNRLFGRNFDWNFSPALLLFTDPADGYASVSMVDIEYLDFAGERSRNLTELPIEDLRALLDAPSLPFDGMNETGLAIGMAAVPAEDMPNDPRKKTLGQVEVIREVLDHAATVNEAIEILESYNIDMGTVPIHYMIASASGESAVVEFYQGEMLVFRNEAQWQVVTNFLLASTAEDSDSPCWRYDLMSKRLYELEGRISSKNALHLLEDVSQDNTQWSILYNMTTGDLQIVMGRDYAGAIHMFHLEQAAR